MISFAATTNFVVTLLWIQQSSITTNAFTAQPIRNRRHHRYIPNENSISSCHTSSRPTNGIVHLASSSDSNLDVGSASGSGSDNGSDTSEELQQQDVLEKATRAMTAFTNKYLQNTGTTLCSDLSVPAVVVKGLAEHKVQYGSPLCPCRFYEDKEAEVKNGYWNCPCVPMRERHECHCMLFLTEDNAFAGDQNSITVEQVIEYGGGGA